MDYEPWPEEGCSLGEALARTSGDLAWTYWRERSSWPEYFSKDDPASIDKQALELRFREKLLINQLVAYGRAGGDDTTVRPIDRQALLDCQIDWERSAIQCPLAGAYDQIRVFPLLLAPCAVQLLNGWPLQETFREFVFRDAEVLALSERALQLAPGFEPVFTGGRCHAQGVAEWPVGYDRWCMVSAVHPDPTMQSVFDRGEPDPIEAVIAVEALKHRYRCLVFLLRTGELEAYGVSEAPSHPCEVPRAVWSHEDFHIRSETGDIMQTNDNSTDFHDRLIRRWAAVTLRRGEQSAATFHVKTTEHADLPPRTAVYESDKEPARRSSPKRDAVKAAMIEAGLDPMNCELQPKAIASRIQPYLTNPPADELAWQALSKMISRIIGART